MAKQKKDAFASKKTFKERFTENTSAKAFRLGGYSAVSIVVVLVIAVVLNLALAKLPQSATRLDLSADKLAEISEQTKEVLFGLQQDVTVYWVVQDGQEDVTIERLLSHYTDGSRHVRMQKIDPVVNPNFAKQYTEEQLFNNSLIVVSGEGDAARSQYIPYPDIYVTDYETYYQTGEQITEFHGESCLTSAVSYVVSEQLPVMCVLDGHGSVQVDSTLASMIRKQNIEIQTLNLLSAGAVPENCDVLNIFAPETDLSKDEAAAVSAYLKAGGKLLLTTGYIPGKTWEDMPNLAGVMREYGLSVKDGVVYEGDSSHYFQLPQLMLPKIGKHAITAPMETGYYVMYPQPQAITVTDTAGVTVDALLSTSEQGYIKLTPEKMEDIAREAGDEVDSYVVAAAAEHSGGAQMVWFTTPLFTQKQYDETVGGTNTDLFLNAISWMCENEVGNGITIHAKTISNEYLTVPNSAKAIWTVVLVVILPLGVLAVGIYLAVSRRKR